jgi:hypothetical protein
VKARPPFVLSPSRLARFFFHECERHLRYHATPSALRESEGVPPRPHDTSPVTRAILEGGYEWEERVIEERLGTQARIAPGKGPLRERAHSVQATLGHLADLGPGEYIYQPTLAPPRSFLEEYGLTELVELPPCRPDLIQLRADGDEPARLRVIDVKASDALKGSHRVQTALYTMVLRHVLTDASIARRADTSKSGVWLYERPEPESVELGPMIALLDGFLRDRLPRILEAPIEDVPWHLFFRCEWCEYFSHCREEAERTQSVSKIPYLSVGGRTYLREAPWEGGSPIHTLDELKSLLGSEGADSCLSACGSLNGRAARLSNAVQALESGEVVAHGGSSAALPRGESVSLVLTLQREPLSGRIYAAGFRRLKGKQVFGDGARERTFVAESPDACDEIRRNFVRSLHEELLALHRYNEGREWRDQKSLQTYVFDSYEYTLLDDLLLESLDDASVAREALQLLFLYQGESLTAAEEHPEENIPFPVVVLSSTIRELVALPGPFSIRLEDASRALPAPNFDFRYRPSELFSFELSNALKSDALFLAWNRERAEAVDWIRRELRQRLIATGAIVDGLRSACEGRLFAWPPKFLLPGAVDYASPELSRLDFVVRYESFMRALAVRQDRARPLEERLIDGTSVHLSYQAGGRWRVLSHLDTTLVSENAGWCDHLLTPADEQGERAQMGYDDHRYRRANWAPRRSGVRLASVDRVEADTSTQRVTQLVLELREAPDQQPFQRGDEAFLHQRFVDFTSDRIVDRLREIDGEPDADFVRLLRDPAGLAAPWAGTGEVERRLAEAADRPGFTPSQRGAFRSLSSRRLTLVWGPPGTGKTHFLARALLRSIDAHRLGGVAQRVAVTAFTHAAVENLLAEIRDLRAEEGVREVDVFKLDGVRTTRGQGLRAVAAEEAANLPRGKSLLVGGTVYSLRKLMARGCQTFDLLVVDEGSQLKLGELALGMTALGRGGRLLLAGDHLQLPPISQGTYPEPEEGLGGLEGSAFSYLRDRDAPSDAFTCQLLENWRMNATLCRFPAETLYGERYQPVGPDVAARRLRLDQAVSREAGPAHELAEWLLDPAWPLAVGVLEDVRATAENRVEAALVAALSTRLRARLRSDDGRLYPDTPEGDQKFWKHGLFIVSPHHVQIRAIRDALHAERGWKAPPFVDTVDKMQGQQCDAVVVSYGVSDPDTALSEVEFIYSLNRLNVSATRARCKCIVFLPRPLLEPSFDLLQNERATAGLAHMHSLLAFCRRNGESRSHSLEWLGSSGSLTVFRAR